jgi:hypothetical protein
MVRFKCKHHADVQVFDEVAKALLKAMGHSPVIPGALAQDEVGSALAALKQAVAANEAASPDSAWQEQGVSLGLRALPLIDLLAYAEQHQHYVIWEAARF